MSHSDDMPPTSIPDAIAGASDFRVHLMIESLQQGLATLDYDPEQVIGNFPSGALGIALDEVLAWSEQTERSEVRLSDSSAMLLARALLRLAWESPALRPVAEAAVRDPKDDQLSGKVMLKVGTLATVLILVASTSFDIRLPGLVVHKDALSPEMLAGLAKLVEAIRGEIPHTGHILRGPR